MLKPAIVTPYYKESFEVLRRCHESVAQQSMKSKQFFIGDGVSSAFIDQWDSTHLSLPKNFADNGNTPRSVGAVMAASMGYNPIFFLDADNYFLDNHVQEALSLKAQTPKLDVIFSGRIIRLDDGSTFHPAPEDKLRLFADTSTMCFFESAFPLLHLWALIPNCLSPICDRIMYESIRAKKLSFGWTQKPTMIFESHYKCHYQAAARKNLTPLHDPDWLHLKELLPRALILYQRRTGLAINVSL